MPKPGYDEKKLLLWNNKASAGDYSYIIMYLCPQTGGCDIFTERKGIPTDNLAYYLRLKQLMKKILFTLTFLLLALTQAPARPKVGVVLSGGGAKGTAHIGVLKVLEKAGIPIDYIVGTSMGAIVGSLYSIGYSPEELDSIMMEQNWMQLLSDQKARENMSLESKEQSDKYILSLPFHEKPQDAITGGVLRGRNIGNMLWELTEGYHDSIDFRKMPIPFACVSQDVVTGKEIVHTSGVLPIAVRASMSLPGVFAPVVLGDHILVDGGMVNNYPVDVARSMGADIIIGADVQEELKTADELENDIFAQLMQLIDLQSQERWKNNIKNTDVYIKINIKGYNTASFKTEAIDTLIHRGEQATLEKLDQIVALKERLGDFTTDHPGRHSRPIRFSQNDEEKHEQYKHLLVGDAPKNTLNLGARYDNEEMAALIFNTQMQFKKLPRHTFALTLRLGKKMFGRIDYAFHLGQEWNLAAAYKLEYNDFNIYNKGERVCEVNFNQNQFIASVGRSWKNILVNFGGELVNFNYGDFLFKSENHRFEENIRKESYLKLGAECSFNSLDHPYFATRGQKFTALYKYVIPTQKARPFHVASIHWQSAVSPNSRFTFLSWAAGRYVTASNTVSESNTLGGQEAGKYFEQQIPFYGINRFEITHRTLAVGGIELRQRIGKVHYVSLIGNLAITTDRWLGFIKNGFGGDEEKGYHIIGGAIKYDWKTIIGPIGATLHYSSRGNKFGGYVRAGFNF